MPTILSLGAGVQSTALLLMACLGEIEPKPDYAIFADTGWEPQPVYSHLAKLSEFSLAHGIPVLQVNRGNLRDDLMNVSGKRRFASIPFHIRLEKGNQWSHGMARRQCTQEYKLAPLKEELRRLGATRKAPAEVWLGISTDEVVRAKPSRVLYAVHRFPLIEQGMTRQACESWLTEHDFAVPPKSACIGCPFHDAAGWRSIREDPQAWADALEVDAAIRELPRFKGAAYLHRSLKPLGEARIDTADEVSLFDLECEGMCGV